MNSNVLGTIMNKQCKNTTNINRIIENENYLFLDHDTQFNYLVPYVNR